MLGETIYGTHSEQNFCIVCSGLLIEGHRIFTLFENSISCKQNSNVTQQRSWNKDVFKTCFSWNCLSGYQTIFFLAFCVWISLRQNAKAKNAASIIQESYICFKYKLTETFILWPGFFWHSSMACVQISLFNFFETGSMACFFPWVCFAQPLSAKSIVPAQS